MVTIEIDTQRNGDVLFAPAGVKVRGAMQATNFAEEDIGQLVRDFPRGLPGGTISYDPATQCGFIRDSLGTAPELAKEREAIERRAGGSGQAVKMQYPDAEQKFENAHGPTWTGHMRRLVAAGVARVVKGKLPDSDPEGMKTGFYHTARTDPKDATITQLVALLTAKLSPEERKQLGSVLAGAK